MGFIMKRCRPWTCLLQRQWRKARGMILPQTPPWAHAISWEALPTENGPPRVNVSRDIPVEGGDSLLPRTEWAHM